jgi:hypothetical protein
VHRIFCRNCGSPLVSRRPGPPEVIRVRIGTLDTYLGPSRRRTSFLRTGRNGTSSKTMSPSMRRARRDAAGARGQTMPVTRLGPERPYCVPRLAVVRHGTPAAGAAPIIPLCGDLDFAAICDEDTWNRPIPGNLITFIRW